MFFLLLILLIVLSLIDKSYQYQIVRVPLSFFGIRHPLLSKNKSFSSSSWQLLAETSSNNLNNDNNNISKTKNNNPPLNRKKKKIVINTNLIGVDNISSDGNLTEQKEKQKEAQKIRESIGSNLGKTSKKKKNNNDLNRNNNNKKKKISNKAQKLVDQRTANGAVDGTLQAGLAIPEEQEIQVQEVKRGNKQVTIVRLVQKPFLFH